MTRRSTAEISLRIALVVAPPVVLLILELLLNKTNLDGWQLALWSILLAGLGGVLGQQIEIEKRILLSDQDRKEGFASSKEEVAALISRYEHDRDDVLSRYEERMGRLFDTGQANLRAHGSMTRVIDHYAGVVKHAAGTGFDKDIEILFAQRLLHDTEEAMRLLAEEHRYQLEVRSPANQFSSRWSEMLDSLMGANGEFKTITNAVVWSADHLGFQQGSSAYLNKQVKAAKSSGFRVKRLFIVPDMSVLRSEPGLAGALELLFRRYQAASDAAGERMQARVLEVGRDDYANHFANAPKDFQDAIGNGWSGNFGVWMSDAAKTVNLVRYDRDPLAPMDPAIEAICFLCSEKVARQCSDYFELRWVDEVSPRLSEYFPRLVKLVADLQAPTAAEPVREVQPAPRAKGLVAPPSSRVAERAGDSEAQSPTSPAGA